MKEKLENLQDAFESIVPPVIFFGGLFGIGYLIGLVIKMFI